MTHRTDLVERQVQAFRERDLERFLACYSEHAVIKDADGNAMMSGIESIREMYGRLFKDSPELAVDIPSQMAVGEYVIHEEQIEGFNLPGYPVQIHAVAVYRVTDTEICEVTLLM